MSDDVQYMSQEKYDELVEEFHRRKTEGRKDIAASLAYAKSLGDLSENFEYHDAKDRQADNEKRIMELEAAIKNAKIVEQSSGGDRIQIGSTFEATREGATRTYELVGSNEADPIAGKISNESPIGQAFLDARVGDTVVVQTPGGEAAYTVERIT